MKTFQLFVDESGVANPKDRQNSDLYVLSGTSISSERREEIKVLADQIKFKYWGRTDIVFHSREIGRDEGDFSIFKADPALKKSFITDLLFLLRKAPIILLIIIVDKKQARIKGWNHIKIVKETTDKLIYHFIALVLSNKQFKGKIIIESATAEKDKYYLSSFSYYLSPGSTLGTNCDDIKKALTSLTFVTKNNNDIEEQISDLLCYAAKCKYQQKKGKVFAKNTYEERVIRVLDKKIFKAPSTNSLRKLGFYNKIEAFCVIPKLSKKTCSSLPVSPTSFIY